MRVVLMLRAVSVAVVCAVVATAEASQSPQELLKRAIEEQQAGRFDDAIRDYRAILKQYPKVPLVRSNLGAALAAEGHYKEATTEYNLALKLEPNTAVRLNLALAYYKAGDIQSAVATLQQVHAEQPANLQAVTLLADCDLVMGQNKKVIALLTPLLDAYPNEASFTYLLGTALVRDGQPAKGQVIIDKILRNGDSAEARLLMGTTKYMASDFSAARDDFDRAVALNPSLPDVYAYDGLALLATGDQDGAKKAFHKELEANPNNFESNLRLGAILRHDDDFENALKYLRQALVVRPGDPGARYQIASIEMAQNQLPEAQHDLESLVKDAPDFMEAHVSLATVYFREKRKEDGERERAIYAQAECGPAIHQRDCRQTHGAMKLLRVCTFLVGATLLGQDFQSLAQQAVQLQQAGDFAGAEAAYRQLLQLDPNQVATRVNLAIVLVNLAKYDQAIEQYQAAARLLPGDERIAMNMALAYEKSGRIAEACQQFSTIHDAAPAEDKVTMLLADCSGQIGRDARVVELLQPLANTHADDLAFSYMLGMALLHEHRIDEGQLYLDRILRNGDTAESRYLLATRMFESGDFPAAVEQFRKTLDLNPNLPHVNGFYGQALLNTGDPDAAAAAFRQELHRDENDFAANLGLAQILVVRKEFANAVPPAARAQLIRPDSPDANLATAEALAGTRQWTKAAPYAERAAALSPMSLEAHQTLADIYAKTGKAAQSARERHMATDLEAKAEASATRP